MGVFSEKMTKRRCRSSQKTQKTAANTRNPRGAGRVRDQERAKTRKRNKERLRRAQKKIEEAVEKLKNTHRKRGRNHSGRVKVVDVHHIVKKVGKNVQTYDATAKRVRKSSSLVALLKNTVRCPAPLPPNTEHVVYDPNFFPADE